MENEQIIKQPMAVENEQTIEQPAAVEEQIREIGVRAKVQRVAIPEKENLNEFYQKYASDGIAKLIALPPQLRVVNEYKLVLSRTENDYNVLGALGQDLGSMQITLMVEEKKHGRKERVKIDLYERQHLLQFAAQIAELFHQNTAGIENDLILLTDLLETFREKQTEQAQPVFNNKRNYAALLPETKKNCVAFLSNKNLMQNIDKLIEQSGVVGEENSRRLLFVVASTYKMKETLHVLVQGNSGSGKSHLINTIGQCLPQEDVLSMTRVTSKSFYHYNKEELMDKVILLQDYDSLEEEAGYAFRELQSAGTIHCSTTQKDRTGAIVSTMKTVKSHFASLIATTQAEMHYDTMNRSVMIGIDESQEQTKKIMEYQHKKLAGHIDSKEEEKAKFFLQNCIRALQPMEVVNPYSDKIQIPLQAKTMRRLHTQYQVFIKQITLLHQYQRKKDEQGRLITEEQDIEIASRIFFDAIMMKIDDLDSSLRHFFDELKNYVTTINKEKQAQAQPVLLSEPTKSENANQTDKINSQPHSGIVFTQREIRLALNLSKTQCFRQMEELEKLEYVQRIGGYANRGFQYKITYWDDMKTEKERIKSAFCAFGGSWRSKELGTPPLMQH
ncbi:MAG: hypothetical protein ABI199_03735 [Bacteroidia bacterium]